MRLASVLELFGVSEELRSESLETAGVQGSASKLAPVSFEALMSHIVNIPGRDSLRLIINLDDGEALVLRWPDAEDTVRDFLAEVTALSDIADADSSFTVRVEVQKKVGDHLSIYSLDAFVSYLQGGALRGIYHVFNEAKVLGARTFEVFDSSGIIRTKAYVFASDPVNLSETASDLIGKRADRAGVAHFSNVGEYDFVPEDFYVNDSEVAQSFGDLYELLNTASTATCLTYIANISGLVDTGLSVRIDGYRSISVDLGFSTLRKMDHHLWYSIYRWIYSEGVLSDRLGLARNVLTLHVEDPHTLKLTGDVLASIRSNHKLYLTSNLQKYVDVNNRVVQFFFDIQQKSASAVDGFVQAFKGSALIFPTFFTSVILLNAVRGNNLLRIITGEIFLIAICLLIVSALHLLAAYSDLRDRREAVSRLYAEMRGRYATLLDPADLDRLLPDTRHPDAKAVDRQVSRYVLLWIGVLIIFLLLVVTLYLIGLGAPTPPPT